MTDFIDIEAIDTRVVFVLTEISKTNKMECVVLSEHFAYRT